MHTVDSAPGATAAPVVTPPVVFLPVSLDADGRPDQVRLVRLGDGRVALLAWSALDRLVACCGEDQPWVLVRVDGLAALHDATPFDLRLLDVPLPDDVRALLRGAA